MSNVTRVVTWRQRQKQKAVELLGGKCCKCGYDRCIAALEVHHINPEEKEFAFSVTGNTRSWSKVLAEINKCELLCANCHREHHYLSLV
jgi:5-methylcytosine-specific restriction endonuclease McrA